MPEYLIDSVAMATFWVTAPSEELAVGEVKRLTQGLDLHVQVGWKTSIFLVDVTCRDDDPEVIEVRDDEGEDYDDDQALA